MCTYRHEQKWSAWELAFNVICKRQWYYVANLSSLLVPQSRDILCWPWQQIDITKNVFSRDELHWIESKTSFRQHSNINHHYSLVICVTWALTTFVLPWTLHASFVYRAAFTEIDLNDYSHVQDSSHWRFRGCGYLVYDNWTISLLWKWFHVEFFNVLYLLQQLCNTAVVWYNQTLSKLFMRSMSSQHTC